MAITNYYNADQLRTEKELRKVISSYPKILDKRIRADLDHHCLELINHSKMVVSAFNVESENIRVLSSDDVEIVDSQTLNLHKRLELNLYGNGSYISLYFLVPGIGHGLRVNGFISPTYELKINNVYLHCARAAARAELWKIESYSEIRSIEGPTDTKEPLIPEEIISPKKFLTLSPFLFIKTMNKRGETEISPRGDMKSVALLIDEETLFIPERPGNKVAISLRNILDYNSIELVFFIPGNNWIMTAQGKANISQKTELLQRGIINGKRPKLGILIRQCQFDIQVLSGLEHDSPWKKQNHIEVNQVTKFSKALSAHMNGEGLLGKASAPVIDVIVKNDMKNLY